MIIADVFLFIGSKYGLRLTLNLEEYDNAPGLNESVGAKVYYSSSNLFVWMKRNLDEVLRVDASLSLGLSLKQESSLSFKQE